jgi:hypothetical protein
VGAPSDAKHLHSQPRRSLPPNLARFARGAGPDARHGGAFRLCYAGFGERFIEALRPVGQIALRNHHYAGVAWRVPSLFYDRPWVTVGSSIGSPGPDFYTDKYSAEAVREWREAVAPIMAAGRSGGRIREDEARHIPLNRWEPGNGFLHDHGLLVTPAMELNRLPTLPAELYSAAPGAGTHAATPQPGPGVPTPRATTTRRRTARKTRWETGDEVGDEYNPDDYESEEDDAGDADWKPPKGAGGVRLARPSAPPSEAKQHTRRSGLAAGSGRLGSGPPNAC